eukprot:gene15596-15744_t
MPEFLTDALGDVVIESVYKDDILYLVVLRDVESVVNLEPNLSLIEKIPCRAVIVTALGEKPYDFVSRYFAPSVGIPEDPVCGSAHCRLAPFWYKKGTRGKPGEPGIYQPGIAALYRDLNVPVLPVALNSGVFWGRRSPIKKPGTIILRFLRPIPPGLSRPDFITRLEESIETALSLREILRFDLDQPLQTSDLCKILGESSFSPFQRALTHLSDFGGDFILQLPIFEETQFLEVVHEKGLYQAYQKEQDEEIEILRTLVDIAPLALWHRDPNGRIQYCNLAYSGALETTVHRRRFIEIAEIPIPGTHKTVGYAMDITEIEEAELELSLHINAHQEVLDQISAPIAIYGADTRIKFFNHAYQNLRERRFLPEYPNFLNHKRARLDLFKNLLYPIHEVLNQPNGQTLRLVIAPHPLGGLLYLFDDITDKLTLERGYNTLVAVQKETLDHLYEGIVVFGSDNRVRLSNPAMGRIWHLSDEKRAADLHINELLKNVAPLFSDPNESKLWRKRMMDIVSLRQNGSHLMSFVDVSDRWRFEQALQERTQTLERADRLKSDFISLVSYELKSPLNTIVGFIEILINQYFGQLNERQLDYCQGIADASDRLMNLINDMLDLANIEAGKLNLDFQEIQLDKFLNSLVDLVYNRAYDQGLELIIENTSSHGTMTQSNQMGAGLGLSLVRSLVELHGGFVSLASEANEGTMIACHLPITHSEA